MSFDIFFQRFQGGEPVQVDRTAVLAILSPLIAERGDDWFTVSAEDGSADISGLSEAASGFMVNHASGRVIWDLMYEVAQSAGLTVMPVGCGTGVVGEGAIDDLPDGVPEPIVVVKSGAELLEMVEAV